MTGHLGSVGLWLLGLGGLWLGMEPSAAQGLVLQQEEEPVSTMTGGAPGGQGLEAWPWDNPTTPNINPNPDRKGGGSAQRAPGAEGGGSAQRPPAPQNLEVGALLVTELMIDPAAVPDSGGEWLELLNRSGAEINLRGVELRDCGVDRFLVTQDFRLAPGERVVLGAAPQGRENGGVPVELVWEDYQLGNRRDCVVVQAGETEVDRVKWEGGWKVPVGAALQLDPGAEAKGDNDDRRRWCRSRAYGDNHEGDRGSPGKKNHRCGRQ